MITPRMLKEKVKDWIYRCPFLRGLLVNFYKLKGRRPWSAGYSFYKYSFVKDVIEHQRDIFLNQQLPACYGEGLDERAVEYPWFFARLKSQDKRILDAGSSLNHHDLLNLSLWHGRKLHITTLAYEGCPSSTVIKPVYTYEDLRAMNYPDAFFDAVACISTLEHVGMDNTLLYTDDYTKKENAVDAHLQAVDEMKRVLKEGGTLYLTVPYGRHQNYGWFQIFDEAMVAQVIARFAPQAVSSVYYKYDHRQWNIASQADCAQGYYVDIYTQANYNKNFPVASQCVACLEMTK